MIFQYRNASIAPGKTVPALAFAKEVAGYVKDKAGVEIGVAMPIGGNPNRVGWAARHENLAAFEAMQTKLLADPKYLELIAKGADNFIAGSIHEEFWRTV
jgi:hypothetical protein